MKTPQILLILTTIVGSFVISSCGCCTGEERPPSLRPLPEFNNVPTPVIEDAK